MSNIITIARRDFLDARRSKLVWAVFGLYSTIALLIFAGPTLVDDQVTSQKVIRLFTTVGLFLLPFIALVAGYLSIAGERERGTVNVLLGLPNTRREVVLGKFLSRGVLMLTATLLVFLIGIAVAVTQYAESQLLLYVPLVTLTALLVLVMVAVAVGISAMTKSRSRAMAGAVGFYFVTIPFNLLPDISVPAMIRYLTNDLFGLSLGEDVFNLVRAAISPAIAYLQAVVVATEKLYISEYSEMSESTRQQAMSEVGNDAWFLSIEAMIAILLVWLAVPLVVGYLRFRTADLG